MLKLTASQRDQFGKQLKPARAAGQLPAVMYGRKTKTAPLFVKTLEFKKIFAAAGESAVIALDGLAGENNVLIHDVTFHPVTGEPLHADFYVVEKDVAIEVAVPLKFAGVSPAVKELGGALVKVLHELKIEALPQNLPAEITVELAPLATLESQILVRDLILSSDIKVLNEPDEVVAAVTVVKEEPVEETAPVDLSAIEVEKRGKEEKVEGEAGADEAAAAAEKGTEKK